MQNSLAEAPFSILGLDVHRNNAGERALALTGTLDKSCVALKGWVLDWHEFMCHHSFSFGMCG